MPLHRGDVGNRGIIEIFPPDERHEIGEKRLAECFVAGNRARLDEGRAFPVLAKTFVIGISRRQRDRDRCRSWVGTQAQIDALDIAVRRPLL